MPGSGYHNGNSSSLPVCGSVCFYVVTNGLCKNILNIMQLHGKAVVTFIQYYIATQMLLHNNQSTSLVSISENKVI